MIRHAAANPAQVAVIEKLKTAAAAFEAEICAHVSNNRERALALTNLEQASMWATVAVVEDQRHKELVA